jgi:CRISPR-associated endonuclease/helicase Cas3
MRTLVEQTADVARTWLGGIERGEASSGTPIVPVHQMMGGEAIEHWHLQPESEAVLVGTQDMLLSRALNRGYGAPRGRWPMEYALLHNDSLWILDEIQLMDVGLTTTVQLQAAREIERAGSEASPAPSRSWWMSATLQPGWLETLDFETSARALAADIVRPGVADETGAVIAKRKPLAIERIAAASDDDCAEWARCVANVHTRSEGGPYGRVTLAITNTVNDATALFAKLEREFQQAEKRPELHLVHSRFRPLERRAWKRFLSRDACLPDADRIIVSTQVIEAGVDITASALVTQLATWPSLVQRFGRAGRYGDPTRILVIDRDLTEKAALPYEEEELSTARIALSKCTDASPAAIDALEDRLHREDESLLYSLYANEPLHELSLREFDDLFDTGPDLTGIDLDVSRFIRTGEERDLSVWWWPLNDDPPAADLQPNNDALCPVPVHRARAWLANGGRLKEGCRSFVWDYLDGRWRRANTSDLHPGRIVLVDLAWGGYHPDLGWTGRSAKRGDPVIATDGTCASTDAELLADLAQSNENLSESPFKTIATHGREVAEEVAALAKALGLDDGTRASLDLAARLHDYGKAHPAFQGAMDPSKRPAGLAARQDLAKAPDCVWRRGAGLFGDRRGLRHELASTLGMFALLRHVDPWHAALLGHVRAFVDAGVIEAAIDESDTAAHATQTGLQRELAALDAHGFDLVAYLVCAHHGKIRAGWQATPQDQDRAAEDGLTPLRGVLDGDRLPAIALADSSLGHAEVPGVVLHLDLANMGLSSRFGLSWRDRTTRLRHRVGHLRLAYLESVLRTADVRASRRTTVDPLLAEVEGQS